MNEDAALIQKQAAFVSTPLSFKEREALLHRQAEARVIIAKAVSLVSKNQMVEADQLLSTLVVSGGTPTVGVAVFRALGDWAAVQGNWPRAAEYYSAFVPVDRCEEPLLATRDYNKYAVVLAEMDNRRAYENVCAQLINQFGDNPALVERIVKTCSLLPPSASSRAALSPLAEKMVKSIARGTDPNGWALPWECMSLAMFEYRRSNYAEAVNWGNRGLSLKKGAPMERIASTQAILAMSYHQLGQAEQAQSALRISREGVEKRWKIRFTGNENWYDWFFARILEREAAAIIEPHAPGARK